MHIKRGLCLTRELRMGFVGNMRMGRCLAQEEAAAAERLAGVWGPDQAASARSLDAVDWSNASPEELQRALAARRAAAAERESALQQWAVALECEAARQASERRSLQLKAEQVTAPQY